MASPIRLATVYSRINGHHEYRYNYRVGESFRCSQQGDNYFSRYAIIVRSNNDQVIGHVPDGLAKIFYALFEDGKTRRITAGKVTNEARSAPGGTWNQGG